VRAVNLIPAEQRGGASVGAGRSEGAAYAVLALVAGVAVLALLYGIAKHQVSSRRTQAASLTAQAQRAQDEAGQLAPYTSFVALRQQREQAVAQVVDSRFDWAHSFHELGRVLPAGVSVSSLTGSIGGAGAGPGGATTASASTPKTGGSSTPPGSVPIFTIAGCATSQQTVAALLDRLRLMDGVAEVTLQSSSKSGSAGGASGGSCPPNDPAYSLLVTFDPLPASSGPAATTSPASTGAGVVK
jgi:Tfp pilus assembly protein PilN